MTSYSKVYLVYEFGGEYEDRWEQPVGVCSTLQLAEELKAKVEAERQGPECSISEEKYNEMLDTLYEQDFDEESYETDVDGLLMLFPQYSRDELEAADKKYFSYNDYLGVEIEEIDFYN